MGKKTSRKLNERQIVEVAKRAHTGKETHTKIAKDFGISFGTVGYHKTHRDSNGSKISNGTAPVIRAARIGVAELIRELGAIDRELHMLIAKRASLVKKMQAEVARL